MKKILITRKLLKSNEEKVSKIFKANLNSNDEPNILVKLGVCADTGLSFSYYYDPDEDGLGSGFAGDYCQGYEPDGLVLNNNDTCYGALDCLGVCLGNAQEDNCGKHHNSNLQLQQLEF